ncbi:hypothetical protein LSAT2_001801 [Lamellibrachia satsuma]|nr:hypothetical protein LSAT2_001801 [Lamellibrachia satsuma]
MIKNIPGASDFAGDLVDGLDLPEELGDIADAVGEIGDEMPDMEGMRGGLKKAGKMGKMAGNMGKMAGKMSDGMSLPEDMGEMSDMVGDVGGALKMGRKVFGSLGNGLDMIEDENIPLPGRKAFGNVKNGLDMIGGKKKKKPGLFGKLFKFGGMIKDIPGASDFAGDLVDGLDLPEELGDIADAVGEIGDEMPDMEGMRGGLKKAGKMGKMAGKMGKMSGGMSLPEDMGDVAGMMDDAMDMAGKMKEKSPGGMGDRLPKLPGGQAVGRNGNGHNLPYNGMTQAGVSYAIPNQTRPKLPAPEVMTDPLDDPLDELPSDQYENVPQDLWHDALWTRSKDAADSCIREQTQNGIYLIRYSDDHQAVLVVHVPAKRLCKFKIKKTMDNQVYIRENEDFSSGEHLLAYYKCHDLPGYSTPLTKSYRRV